MVEPALRILLAFSLASSLALAIAPAAYADEHRAPDAPTVVSDTDDPEPPTENEGDQKPQDQTDDPAPRIDPIPDSELVGPPPFAAAAPRISWAYPPNGVYYIRNAYNGAGLVGSNYDGTDYAWVFKDYLSNDMLFYLADRGNGWYTIQCMNIALSGYYLKAWESYTGVFGKPGTWYAPGDYSQNAYCQWGPAIGGDGNWYWVNRAYRDYGILDVLDIAGDYSSGDRRCNVNTDGYDGSNGQTWYLQEVRLSGSAAVSGTARVGSELICTPSISSYNVGSVYHTWYYGDTPGATDVKIGSAFKAGASSITVPAEAAGKYITCVVSDNEYRGTVSATAPEPIGSSLSGSATITGGYVYAGSTLTCTASDLPAGAVPAYAWYAATEAGGTDKQLGTGATYNPTADDIGKHITCVVTDASGIHSGNLTAIGEQVTASLALDASPTIEAVADGAGNITCQSIRLVNRSSCPVRLVKIGLDPAAGVPTASTTIESKAGMLCSADASAWDACPIADPPILAVDEELSLSLSLAYDWTGPIGRMVSNDPLHVGTLTFFAEAA